MIHFDRTEAVFNEFGYQFLCSAEFWVRKCWNPSGFEDRPHYFRQRKLIARHVCRFAITEIPVSYTHLTLPTTERV